MLPGQPGEGMECSCMGRSCTLVDGWMGGSGRRAASASGRVRRAGPSLLVPTGRGPLRRWCAPLGQGGLEGPHRGQQVAGEDLDVSLDAERRSRDVDRGLDPAGEVACRRGLVARDVESGRHELSWRLFALAGGGLQLSTRHTLKAWCDQRNRGVHLLQPGADIGWLVR